jgi:hypothetical protein
MTKNSKTSFNNMTMTMLNSTILFICMWAYEVMMNTNGFKKWI